MIGSTEKLIIATRTRLARIAGLGAIGLGILGSIAWWTGWYKLPAVGAIFQSITLSSSGLLLVMGTVLYFHDRLVSGSRLYTTALAAIGACLLISAGFMVVSFLGLEPYTDELRFQNPVKVGFTEIGYLSPLGAILFFFAGLVLFITVVDQPNSAARIFTFTISSDLTVISAISIAVGVFGRSGMHTSRIILPAMSDALGVLVLGSGICAALWPWSQSRLNDIHQKPRIRFRMIAAMVVATVITVTVPVILYLGYEARIRNQVTSELASVVQLKVDQLTGWGEELKRDAAFFGYNEQFVNLYRRVTARDGDVDAEKALQAWLAQIQTDFRGEEISVYDLDGNRVRSAFASGVEPTEITTEEIIQVVNSGVPQFVGFQRFDTDDLMQVIVLAPMAEHDNQNQALGVLAFVVSLRNHIYPLLQKWPTESATAKTVLVRRDGGDVLILSDRTVGGDEIMLSRILVTSSPIPATMAARGQEGIFEGRDHGGEPVLAVVLSVPDTPWFMVARLDVKEIYGPIRERLWWMMGTVIVFLLFIATTGAAIWYRSEQVRLMSFAVFERQKHRSEAKYRLTLKSIGDAVITTDSDGRIEFMNPMAEKLTGWTEAEAIGSSLDEVAEIAQENSRETVGSAIKKTMNEEAIIGYSGSLLIARDGVERPIVESEAFITDDDGTVSGSVLILHDQSYEREAQRSLEDEVERSQQFLDVAGVILLTLDSEGLVTQVNQRGCAVLGLPRDRIIGQNWFDTFIPDIDRDRVREFFYHVMDRYTIDNLEVDNSILTAGGEIRTISWKNALLRNSKGSVIGILSSGEDVTERREAEEKLRRSEAEYHNLFDCIRDAILVTDVEGRITNCNKAFTDVFGYEANEAVGKTIGIIFETESGYRSTREVFETNSSEFGFHVHTRNVRKDGTALSGETSAYNLQGVYGKVVGSVYLIRDISERLEAELKESSLKDQLAQAQKMESIGLLAGGIAHDFNNMLAVILGHAEILLGQMEMDDSQRPQIVEIQNAANRSADLTYQLLAFARKQVSEPQNLDINETVDGTLGMLRRLIDEDINLVWKPGDNLWRVRMDPIHIDQILANLVINARDAIAGVGEVIIESANVTIDQEYAESNVAAVPGDYVLIAVSDTGSGMSDENLSQVFEPFFTTKAIGSGTGLGLATVYGIVTQNNGFLHAYSEVGEGTIIRIYIPRYRGDMETLATDEPIGPVIGGHESILLVEDESSVRELVALMLRDLGYSVIAASSPADALLAISEQTAGISLVLTDVIMPEMNGHELALRITDKYPNIKTLFMSGYSAEVIAHRGILDEGFHLISKPFTTRQLAQKIRSVLNAE